MNALTLIGLIGVIIGAITVVSNRPLPHPRAESPTADRDPARKKHTRRGIGLGVMAFASIVLCTGCLLTGISIVVKAFLVFAMTGLIMFLLYAVAAARHRHRD